jgi:tetratricopeptide (TPR) repeat protein
MNKPATSDDRAPITEPHDNGAAIGNTEPIAKPAADANASAANASAENASAANASAANASAADGGSAAGRGRRRWRLAVLVLVLVALSAGLGIQWHWRSAGQRFRRGLEAADRRDAAGIRRELPNWPRVDAFEPHRHFLVGALFLLDGQPEEALNELRYSRDVPELHVRTMTLAGQALYQLGQQAEALKPLSRAIDVDPNAIDAHRWIASSYYDLGAIHHALSHLQIIATLDPRDPRPHRLMGLMHKDFEHYSDAIACYRESLTRDPAQSSAGEIRLELAECQTKQREYQDALATLAEAPQQPATWVLAAECHIGLTHGSDADPLIARALASDPDNLAARMLAATRSLEAGRVDEAAGHLRQAVDRHPRDYTARFKLSQVYRRVGKIEDADRELKTSEEIKALRDKFTKLHEQAANAPQDAELRYQLGETAIQLDRPDLALGWFRVALSLNPRHAGAATALQRLTRSPPPSSKAVPAAPRSK